MHFISILTKTGILLCGLFFICSCEGNPVKRRAVSEMQLMHNYGEFRQSMQRHEWLQLKIQNVYPASVSTPQESTAKVAETKPHKPHKKENKPENRTKNVSHPNQRTSHKKARGHGNRSYQDKALEIHLH
ncbi:parathyroid hormone [Bombina bombina]|uniref:parathyroid hormone n=1 Tax=Bombina bombina TaxID=8345 RepID=UPI00235B0EF5|nr:parathyroid hormone [Bombina bombina]